MGELSNCGDYMGDFTDEPDYWFTDEPDWFTHEPHWFTEEPDWFTEEPNWFTEEPEWVTDGPGFGPDRRPFHMECLALPVLRAMKKSHDHRGRSHQNGSGKGRQKCDFKTTEINGQSFENCPSLHGISYQKTSTFERSRGERTSHA